MANDAPIRVGVIRADTHAVWYGVLMDEHDPRKLQHPWPDDQEVTYGWQRGGTVFRYFYAAPGAPTEMTVEPVDGFQITKVWDADRATAQCFADVFHGKPHVCDALDEASDDVDLVLVADCNFDGADHVELATPGLTKGIATFVDKPFGGTHANGSKLVELADKHNAPIHTRSILQEMPVTQQFQERFATLGELHHLAIHGGGTSVAGLIHTICLAQHLFGPNVGAVRAMADDQQQIIMLEYPGADAPPRNGASIVCNVGRPYSGMYAHMFGDDDFTHVIFDDFRYTLGARRITEQIRDMVRTGETPRKQVNEMLAALRTLDAMFKALDTGQCVTV